MMTVTDDKNDGRVDNAIARDGQHLNERNDFPKGESHMDPEMVPADGFGDVTDLVERDVTSDVHSAADSAGSDDKSSADTVQVMSSTPI